MKKLHTNETNWFLLADIRYARLLRCSVTTHGRCHFDEYDRLQSDYPDKEHEVTSPLRKRAGMTYGIENGYEPESVKHFARQLNRLLPGTMSKYEIEHLFLIAPSRFLGELRNLLKPELQRKVDMHRGEWIHLPIRKLAEHPVVRELIGLDDS